MITRLDHVVIGVRDLDEAIRNYQQLGFDVRPGGRHTGLGTHNALIRFGLDYIELLAVYDESEVTRSGGRGHFMTEHLRDRPGALLGFALASDNLEDEAARGGAPDSGYMPGQGLCNAAHTARRAGAELASAGARPAYVATTLAVPHSMGHSRSTAAGLGRHRGSC